MAHKLPEDFTAKTLNVTDDATPLMRRVHGASEQTTISLMREHLKERRTHAVPDAVREVFRMVKESKAAAGPAGGVDTKPIGFEALRAGLELAIEYSLQQKLISRRFAVEELFDDVTIGLA